MSTTDSRGQWGSKLGFIMAAAGSAVGLGNFWRFPYLAGVNEGAVFVLVYVVIIAIIGYPLMIAEFSLGRRTQLNPLGAFRKIRGGPWVVLGWLCIIIPFLILSFYGVVAGWTIKYFFMTFGSLLPEALDGNASKLFADFVGNWQEVVFYQCIFMVVTIMIVAMGVEKGIEACCKFMMPLLYVILFVLIARGLTLPGGMAGVEFYLKPDFSKINGKMVLDALGQAFFSLSLGMGILITYGSYLDKKEDIAYSAKMICIISTSLAFFAGFAIFPCVFAVGLEPAQGPGLAFITCPAAFARMPGGMFFSAMFFFLFFLAGLTSSISILEVCCSYVIDELKWSRRGAAIIVGVATTLLGIPSALSLSGIIPKMPFFGKELTFMDLIEQLSSNISLPLVGILVSVFVGWLWKEEAKMEITNEGALSFSIWPAWLFVCRFIAPVAIAFVLGGSF